MSNDGQVRSSASRSILESLGLKKKSSEYRKDGSFGENDDKELKRAYKTLLASDSTNDSTMAAQMLLPHLEEFDTKEVVALWPGVKNLLKASNGISIRNTGFDVVVRGIAGRTDLEPLDRMIVYDLVENHRVREDTDRCFEVLNLLTNSGRDIYPFESHVVYLVVSWMKSVYDSIENEIPASERKTQNATLHNIFVLVTNVCKFQFSLLTQDCVEEVLMNINHICCHTGAVDDVVDCFNIYDSITRYGIIPARFCTSIVEILCSAVERKTKYQSLAISVMRNMLSSPMVNAAIQSLKEVMTTNDAEKASSIRGAVEVLSWVLLDDGSLSSQSASLVFCLTSMLSAVSHRDLSIDHDVLKVIRKLLRGVTKESDLAYDDWQLLLDLVTKCAESHRQSHPKQLREDDKAIFYAKNDTIREIAQELFILFKKRLYSCDDEILMMLFRSLYTFASDAIIKETLEYFDVRQQQSSSNEITNDVMDYALKCLTGRALWTPDTRLAALAVIQSVYTRNYSLSAQSQFFTASFDNLVQSLRFETNVKVLEKVAAWLTEIFFDLEEDLQKDIVKALELAIVEFSGAETDRSIADINLFYSRKRICVDKLCLLFLLCYCRSAVPIFSAIINTIGNILQSDLGNDESMCKCSLLDLVLRMRSDNDGTIYLVQRRNISSRSNASSPSSGNGRTGPKYLLATVDKVIEEGSIDDTEYAFVKQYCLLSRKTYRQRHARKMKWGKDVKLYSVTCILWDILKKEKDWQVYSSLIEYLPKLLSNRALFLQPDSKLGELRALVCETLGEGQSLPVRVPSEMRKADVMVLYVEVLIALFPYGDSFSKAQQDDLLGAVLRSMQKWHTTAKVCIHAFFIACFELPLSVIKYLSGALIKLSQLITSANLSLHILEFLEALAKLPDLYFNFTEAEFRQIFGIALQYIQHYNSFQANESEKGVKESVMSKYLLTSAFSVLASWYLSVRLNERRKFVRLIVRGLVLANQLGPNIREQCDTFFDLMVRFTYSNSQNEFRFLESSAVPDENTSKQHWLRGNAILTIKTRNNTGASEVLVRRPTGCLQFFCLLSQSNFSNEIKFMENVKAGESELHPYSTNNLYSAGYLALQSFFLPDVHVSVHPIRLDDETGTRRAISVLDRIPIVELHKIGVLYVKDGQSTEHEILGNRVGPAHYTDILNELGSITQLKGNKEIFTGGLDIEQDLDGEFTYYWRDSITQVVFHVATMMPNNIEFDPQFTMKKRHIGNDFINIVFNESGQEYRFDTVSGQFNFVNIVVTPCSLWDISKLSDNNREQYFTVEIQKLDSLAEFSPVFRPRVVSKPKLAIFLRLVALNASKIAQIHNQGGATYRPNWVERLRQIEQIRGRAGADKLAPLSNLGGAPTSQGEDTKDQYVQSIENALDFTKYI